MTSHGACNTVPIRRGCDCECSASMEVPFCALVGYRGTVLGFSMGFCEDCIKGLEAGAAGRGGKRARAKGHTSDCDTGYYGVSTRHRERLTRKRYVGVLATVCLLAVASGGGGVMAASIQRQEALARATLRDAERLWENPCDLSSNNINPEPYNASLAKFVATQASDTVLNVAKYADEFANHTHSYATLRELLPQWRGYEWFRRGAWFREGMLPASKEYGGAVPDDEMDALMSSGKLDPLLPQLYRGLKVAVAAVHSLTLAVGDARPALRARLVATMHDMRYTLCQFHTLMASKRLLDDVPPLDYDTLPTFHKNTQQDMLLVFRDTVSYVEYLAQVFGRVYERDRAAAP